MKALFKIGAVARIVGCGQQAIRRYDRLELFVPRRDRAGHRVYTSEDIEVLRLIRASRKPGPKKRKPSRPLIPVQLDDRHPALTAKEIERGLKRGRSLAAPKTEEPP
jgi:hypothetical protein